MEVTNFTTSWRDGLALCAIIDRHRPDILNYDDCDPATPLENLAKAFKVAEEELGIIRIVDPEGERLTELTEMENYRYTRYSAFVL